MENVSPIKYELYHITPNAYIAVKYRTLSTITNAYIEPTLLIINMINVTKQTN